MHIVVKSVKGVFYAIYNVFALLPWRRNSVRRTCTTPRRRGTTCGTDAQGRLRKATSLSALSRSVILLRVSTFGALSAATKRWYVTVAQDMTLVMSASKFRVQSAALLCEIRFRGVPMPIKTYRYVKALGCISVQASTRLFRRTLFPVDQGDHCGEKIPPTAAHRG